MTAAQEAAGEETEAVPAAEAQAQAEEAEAAAEAQAEETEAVPAAGARGEGTEAVRAQGTEAGRMAQGRTARVKGTVGVRECPHRGKTAGTSPTLGMRGITCSGRPDRRCPQHPRHPLRLPKSATTTATRRWRRRSTPASTREELLTTA